MAVILDGKATALRIQNDIRKQSDKFELAGVHRPHLAAVLVGEHAPSVVYVNNKIKTCERAGFHSTLIRLRKEILQDELLEEISKLNERSDIDGYIVQLPLPEHIDENAITMAIDPGKDVDGFHPVNLGKMLLGHDTFLPATPMGIMELLKTYQIDISGKHCVVIGRSNIVGTPMSILLSRKNDPGNATVTLTHSRTKNMAEITRQADLIVVAIGKANFLTADMVKTGAIVIDVGTNRVEDPGKKTGYRLTGDADFEQLIDKVSHITPVPGGVGPMTITGLLINTLKASHRRFK